MVHRNITLVLLLLSAPVLAQKSFSDKLDDFAQMLIAQPDKAPDTSLKRIISGNLSMIIPELWYQNGVQPFGEWKLEKCDKEPLASTLPLPDKQLVKFITINLKTAKKNAEARKKEMNDALKKKVMAMYKETGQTITDAELNAKVNALWINSEPFTTAYGKSGTLHFIHDLEMRLSGFTLLFLAEGKDPATTISAQLSFFRPCFENELPDDLAEWRVFLYADDQQLFTDFAKKMLKTFTEK